MTTNNARHLFVIIVTAIFLLSPGHLKVISECSTDPAGRDLAPAKHPAEEGMAGEIRNLMINSSHIFNKGGHAGTTPLSIKPALNTRICLEKGRYLQWNARSIMS